MKVSKTYSIKIALLIFFLLITTVSRATSVFELAPLSANQKVIEEDLKAILRKAALPENAITFSWQENNENYAEITCENNTMQIQIYASPGEWSAVFYMALQKLGFLFPHPRWQISPSSLDASLCGQVYEWNPTLKYRGFHFHTMHPNEWVHAFMTNQPEIAYESIRWLARNQQNIFDFSMLRNDLIDWFDYLQPIYTYAREMGLHTGVAFGVALQQQNSWKLVSLLGTFFNNKSEKEIEKKLVPLLELLPLSFINVEAGTSEFTAVNYERSLNWMNKVAEIAARYNVAMLTKVHVSSNQQHEEYGNYNFLPQYADSTVGVLPHTVFYYALEDSVAPMYGNKNFHDIKDFMLKMRGQRMNWYYPETSYYISMDIDVPLLLLEYLRGRAEDMRFLYEHNINGQLNFTTGHELGYWLFDWTLALLTNLEYDFDPKIALKLLGEDPTVWQEHLDFQYQYLTVEQLIAIVSFSNGGDELMPKHKIHQRNLMRELSKSPEKTNEEIQKLESAIDHIPSTEQIKNEELRTMLDVTYLRFHHALATRKALLEENKTSLKDAEQIRNEGIEKMSLIVQQYNRYPEANIFDYYSNVTAYSYGYGAFAKELYYWYREEEMVRRNKFGAFFMKVYDYTDILF
ncbi:MAG: hypothetical protein KDD32_00400 [Bacteroidetes bacterium]|nr:hypothetical protein [Bacteroidota bacterium]